MFLNRFRIICGSLRGVVSSFISRGKEHCMNDGETRTTSEKLE